MARNPSPPPPNADVFAQQLAAAHTKFAGAAGGEGASQQVMSGFAEAYRAWLEALSSKPEKMLDLQGRYMQEQMKLWMKAIQPDEAKAEEPGDKRFSAPEWSELPVFRYFRDSYLLTSKMMMQAVEEANLDAPTQQRMRFFMRQYLDAAAPSNYLMTNPEALKAAIESRGETLQEGMKNLLADMEKGRISMNKFYIMDLQPDNSLVKYGVDQGHTVFMVSWRNVKQKQAKVTWDQYISELIDALEEARRIAKVDEINALGFCIGGTLVASALAVLERRKKDFVRSLTLLTTLLEFSEVGDIRVYIDENFVEKRQKQLEKGGIVPGQELAGAFSSLRANDLVWSYVVNNYLKGKQPPAFDLLYWNADATNLPGPMYSYYLRNTYADNKLCKPDALEMLGEPVSLKRLKMPTFVFAAREDHIVPWKGGYASARTVGGEVTFILGASGHIAGTINPASKNKRSYWVNGRMPADAEKWFAESQEHPGSWWSEWSTWLRPHGGKLVAARKKLGGGRRKPIEPAPGSYARERL